MDVANEASVIASLDGCEDGFVNSAGIGRDAPFFETCVELFRSASPDEIAVAALFLLDDRKARLRRAYSQRRWRLRRGRMPDPKWSAIGNATG